MAKVTITGPSVRDSTTRKDNRPWYAWAAEYQDGGDGGVVTPRRSRPIYPSQGVLSIELEAGIAAWIQNPDGNKYLVTVPNSNAQLWDVIASAVAYPPDTRTEVLASAVGQYVNDNADVIAVDDVVSASGGTAIQFRRDGSNVGSAIPLPSAAVDSLLGATTVGKNVVKAADQTAARSAINAAPSDYALKQLARQPNLLITGSIARNSDGAVTSAAVTWPDGTTGTFTATTLSTDFPGLTDAYNITYGSPVTRTVSQPTVTRDISTGRITNYPAMVVS